MAQTVAPRLERLIGGIEKYNVLGQKARSGQSWGQET